MASEAQDSPSQDSPSEDFVELPADRFYHGIIVKLFRGRQGGVVRTASGREVPFHFLHVTPLGGLRHFEDLRQGMRVGYDVGWTARGLRVTVLRPLDADE